MMQIAMAAQAMLAVYIVWRVAEILHAHPKDGPWASFRRVLTTVFDIGTVLLGSVPLWVANMVVSLAWVLYAPVPELKRLREEHKPEVVRLGLIFAILLEAAFFFGFQALR